ncbi:5-bromo-4-chloroindolyl phosphate hydrolysis protein [Enterococcus sp. JM4C]|uniref:5-bromo-4-chloroindolyl phosphate hydrolysis family protein n=1 Tax=Candidatus Enterococcus huntleyi TaxID=1857217 RepID=UPI0013798A58|nr:5-bromo-4-chloroindolyl phosphate hydrolysis family protein [Enterococcus sp. JM4C]KAF1295587.1 5-bromo-4-chloroindolyl phosphate hydrolysis protein [Enterococcus sp. JM4C]
MKKKKKIRKLLPTIVLVLLLYFAVEMGFPEFFAFLALGVAFVFFIIPSMTKKKKRQEEILPVLTKEKESHYEQLGMTDREIDLFRNTMNAAKQQIVRLQENMSGTAKLKAIDLRQNTVKASKALFKELTKDPTKLHLANHFLYTHLPNMVDLTDKYIEINNHELKNKQTYEKLEESAQIIDQVAALIAQDYQKFVEDDLEDLDVELTVAKQSLKRDNSL